MSRKGFRGLPCDFREVSAGGFQGGSMGVVGEGPAEAQIWFDLH